MLNKLDVGCWCERSMNYEMRCCYVLSDCLKIIWFGKYAMRSCVHRTKRVKLATVVWLFESLVTHHCSFHFATPTSFHRIFVNWPL